MTSTSLAEQLRKLSAPQSSIYKEHATKASLLFNPKEAALKDRDTFYEIGLSGLNELIKLYEGFAFYEDTLFSINSKDFERAVQSKEVNKNLDQTIEKFLQNLSPFLLLQPAHKALEWLVNRYHIHQYNQDAIVALILPYHETKIFVRFVQMMYLKRPTNRWHWLLPLQKPGLPLTKQVLYNHCSSNHSLVHFIAKSMWKCINEFGARASQLTTLYTFFCSTVIGTIDTCKQVNESLINAVLPTVMKILLFTVDDLRSSAYIIIGYLTSKAVLKDSTLYEIITKLFNTEYDLTYDVVLLINLIYASQKHLKNIPDDVLYNISVDRMCVICKHLKKLVQNGVNVQTFVIKFLSSVMPIIQMDIEEFRRSSKLPEILLDEISLKSDEAEKIIKCFLKVYGTPTKNKDGNESDVEIINEGDLFTNEIIQWYSSILKSLEVKYPQAFDNVIKHELSSNSGISKWRHLQLRKILGFKPAVVHKVGDNCLFEKLNHPNPMLRIEAVNYIIDELSSLKLENVGFVKDSLISRFNDDNSEVVKAVLNISTDELNDIFSVEDLTEIFVTVTSKDVKHRKKWKPVIMEAIKKFCSLHVLPVAQETVLALMPYLFPSDDKTANLAWMVINSEWGRKFSVTKDMANIEKDPDIICDFIFRKICSSQIDFNDILDISKVNKTNTVETCMYLLLKSCSFKQDSIEESIEFLNLILDLVKDRTIFQSSNEMEFSSALLPQVIKYGKQNKLMFELIQYLLSRLIEESVMKDIPKPWCNLCGTSELLFVRRIFEICITGCCIQTYSASYCKLLHKLLERFCFDIKEKAEFISNFACGHILYAQKPDDVIGPELQTKCLKLLHNCVENYEDLTWAHNSEAIFVMIICNMTNPVLIIRQSSIEIIDRILNKVTNVRTSYTNFYTKLMEYKEEMILDHEQIPQIINTILTKSDKIVSKNHLNCFINIIHNDKTPAHICAELVKILSECNNSNNFSLIVPVLKKVEKKMNKNISLDIYESKLLRNIYKRIDKGIVVNFEKQNVWNFIESGMKQFKETVLDDDQTFISPSVLIMKQIDGDVFNKIPENRAIQLVHLISSAGTFSNNPNISHIASKTIKKININYEHIRGILEGMLKVKTNDLPRRKKKDANLIMISHNTAETDEWRIGVTVLEYIQNKKRMSLDNSFIAMLFSLLNKCLRFEDQSYVEYTKQLILSSMWFYSKKFQNENDMENLKCLKSMFNIEVIIQCIRGTQNPQTHHHALILLSYAAHILPEQVLNNTMEIFTFMGSSVLRHDDAYSFQIITKIIETIIPILVKLDKEIDYSEKDLQKLQNRVVPVLRIFADVVLDVPEHRRLPLYVKLISTLGCKYFIWVFIGLLLETHIAHWNDNKVKITRKSRYLAEQESPINRLDFGQSFVLEFPPEIIFESFIKLIGYVKSLPVQKDENTMDTNIDVTEIFSINGHSAVQLRHYKYVIITFMNTCLASPRFIQHVHAAEDTKFIEIHYKGFIINILTFIQSILKINDEKTAKYWRVMLHHSYDLLDNTNNLLSAPMFLSVIRGLLKHNLLTVRRKSMELLNSKIQYSPEMFSDCDREFLNSLLPPLLDIVRTIDNQESINATESQELELNQQTALLSLKLLTRMLASENPEPFKDVLETVTEYTCKTKISGNVMASVVLCLAELCSNLKAHTLVSLRKFMPALIKVLKKQRKTDTPELVLLSTITAISKIIESIPLFLSPYLQKILYEYSIMFAKWQQCDQQCAKVSAIVTKLTNIKHKIASSLPSRVLIPVVNQTHQMHLEKANFDAIGPVMSVLADSFANITTADFAALQQDLTHFFLSALQLRSDLIDKEIDASVVDSAEDEVVNAFVSLVLKLSETSFRPLYFKIYDWAIRTNVDGCKDRAITFYRLSSAIADKLKGLFVLFAAHFIKNAANLLDACNKSKTDELWFESDAKCNTLIEYILKTLRIVFLYDSQGFINKERFETLMQPIVDQLENNLGGVPELKRRAEDLLIPCISQFAVATSDDSLWKLLNYQILLKTRHNDADIRLTALNCLVKMATLLGSSWLPLLAESVPFLAELLEDGDSRIENCTKDAIRTLEQILGEPLEKYF